MNAIQEIKFDGAKITEARGDRPMAEIAEKIGISRQALWAIENGKARPRAEVLMKLCLVLNLDITSVQK